MLSYLREEPIDLPPVVLAYRMRGVRVRNARWRMKITQQKLAELVGVSRQTICTIECSGRMAMPTRRQLETVLGLNLALSPVPLPHVTTLELEDAGGVGGQGDTPAHGD